MIEIKNTILEYRKGWDFICMADFAIMTEILNYDVETDFLKLALDGKLTIKKNYACDGPSGPTFDSRSSVRAAFIHDALYSLMRNGYIALGCKRIADDLLYDYLILDGMFFLRAWFWWYMVHSHGRNSLYPSTEKYILKAP